MPDTIRHDDAIELLPWLVNGTLEPREYEAVDLHAKNCVICRRELDRLGALATALADETQGELLPAPDMRNINARIDADLARSRRGAELLDRLLDWSGNRWRLAFVLQAAGVMALAVVLWRVEPESEFTTLTTPESLPSGDYLRVVFDPGLDGAAISALLEAYGLVLVSGPSERGVYTLGLQDASAERADVSASLEGAPGVLFVQPVTGKDSP